MKTYEESVEMERRKWEKVVREEGERVRQVHEWEMKKKCESYELEVRKLKEVLETVTKSQAQSSSNKSSQNTNNTQTML